MARNFFAALAVALVLCSAALAADTNAPVTSSTWSVPAVPAVEPSAGSAPTPAPAATPTPAEQTPSTSTTPAVPTDEATIPQTPVNVEEATPVPVAETPASAAAATTDSTTAAAALSATPEPTAEATPAATFEAPTEATPAATTPTPAAAPEPTPADSIQTPLPEATPVEAAPTPVAEAPIAVVTQTPAPAPAAAPTPAVDAHKTTTIVAGDEQVGAPAPAAPIHPCAAVPGCTACVPKTPVPSRKLMQAAVGHNANNLLSGISAGGKRPNLDISQLMRSPYDQPNLPMCTACDVEGYTKGSSGRCNCKPGYGDMNPSGYCNLCPDGYISMGGFRAVCQECVNVAWSNDEHTMCLCASGWYGYTNTMTRQATCNQCPGTRPVSKDGSRSAAECFACPAGSTPNEIFSECVSGAPAPPPPPMTLADLLGQAAPPSPPPAPPAPKLYNESTFADAEEDWKIQTRASGNYSNPFTDLIGSVVDSMIMGKPIAENISQPGDLLYQVITKPAQQPKLPDMSQLQNMAGLGGGLAAAAGALPGIASAAQSGDVTKLVTALGAAAQKIGAASNNGAGVAATSDSNPLAQVGSLLSGLAGSSGGSAGSSSGGNALGTALNVLSGLSGSSSSGGSSGNALGTALNVLSSLSGSGSAGSSSGSNNNALGTALNVLSGLTGSNSKGSNSKSASSSSNSLGNLLSGLVKTVQPPKVVISSTPAATSVFTPTIASSVAKTATGFIKVPGAAPKGAIPSNLRMAKPASGSSSSSKPKSSTPAKSGSKTPSKSG